MSKKAVKVDELAELVQDEKILSVLVTRLTAILEPIMEKLVKKMAAEVTIEITASLAALMEQNNREITAKTDEQISHLPERTKTLEDANYSLQSRIEDMERHARLNNLIFHGVPDASSLASVADPSMHQTPQHESDRSLTMAIIQLCHDKLNLNLTELDISTTHRLPGSAKLPYKPLIVSFTSRRVRNEVFSAKKMLRFASASDKSHWKLQDQLFINEHLTKTCAQLYTAARRLVKEKRIASSWTTGGIVHIKLTASPDESPRKILTQDALYKIVPPPSTESND